MTTIAKRAFRIFGPNAGKSGEFGGHYFREGVLFMQESAEVLEHVTRKLSRYGAFPRGSDEYEAAMLRESLEKEAEADGNHDTPDPVEGGGETDKVQGGDGSAGEGTGETPTVDVPGSDDSEAGSERVVSEGDGHQDPELSGDERKDVEGQESPEEAADASVVDETPVAAVNEKMKKVVLSLDPDVEEHWTPEGAPAMAAIEEAYGADFAREDINNAVPEWNREKARELKDLA